MKKRRKSNKKPMRYMVWNVTDNISTHFEPMTLGEADRFIKQFRFRYVAQGYYKDNKWNKIAPEDIKLELRPVS